MTTPSDLDQDARARHARIKAPRPYAYGAPRRIEGLPPVEGGDVLMAQMQDVPLSRAISGEGSKV